MKRFHKRRVLLGVVFVWAVMLLISSLFRPDFSPGADVSKRDHELISKIADPMVWISRGGEVLIRDHRGEDWHTMASMSLTKRVAEFDQLSDLNESYLLVAEDYGALIALALETELPDSFHSLILIDPKGLPSFEWLGNPLLDRSLRSVQLGVVWGIQHVIPFSWRWHHRWNQLLNEAALIAHGGIESTLRNEVFDYPTLLVSSPETVTEQTLAFETLFSRSVVVDTKGLTPPDFDWEASFPTTLDADSPQWVDPSVRKELLARHQRFEGAALWIAMLLIASSTMISEDLACIGSGLLVSHGGMELLPAIIACIVGIFVGDLLIYSIGRVFGERLLTHRPFRWMISREAVVASEEWFRKKGAWVILACRFMPGTRVPVYFAAGLLKSPFWMVATVLGLAAILWVPFLVGLSSWIGDRMLVAYEDYDQWAVWILLGVVLTIITIVHRVLPLLTYRGRRLAYSRWKRLIRWEFWPAKMIYPPVLVYILGLALKYRSLSLATLCNPMLPCGGLIDESKLDILKRLQNGGAPVASFAEIPEEIAVSDKVRMVKTALDEWGSDFPVVIKPEQGERGKGVCIVTSHAMLEEVMQSVEGTQIAQKYIPGLEFGVLYWRHPDKNKGEISSITRKIYTSVIGDGVSSLEQLILKDPRAVCSAATFLKTHAEALYRVPEKDEKVKLVEIGTHSRGSLFMDACDLSTDALLATFDGISHAVDGYYLGRFDLKVPDEASLKEGKGIEIVELNLLSSEPTHMYDPKHSIFEAWRLLMAQWRSAFEIGDQLRKRGMKPMGVVALACLVWNHYTQ